VLYSFLYTFERSTKVFRGANLNVTDGDVFVVQYSLLLLRYNELALKAKKTRHYFEQILIRNISYALGEKQIEHRIQKEFGRIYVHTSKIKEAIPVLQHIFGITSLSPSLTTQSTLSAISKAAEAIVQNIITSQTSFAIRATRTGTHAFSSQDIAIQIGEKIRKKTQATVDLTNPDVTLGIDTRQETTYLFLETYKGVGGLPLGTQGSIGAWITSSPALVATWFLMKRGCTPVFFLHPDIDKEKIERFLLTWYTQASIHTLHDSSLESFSSILNKEDCQALIVDTVDVSNNSLTHLQQLKTHLHLPILTPLLGCSSEDLKIYHEHSEVPR